MGSRLDIYGLDIELSGWVCHCTVILVDQQATVSDDSPTATISIARTAEYEMGMATNWVSLGFRLTRFQTPKEADRRGWGREPRYRRTGQKPDASRTRT